MEWSDKKANRIEIQPNLQRLSFNYYFLRSKQQPIIILIITSSSSRTSDTLGF